MTEKIPVLGTVCRTTAVTKRHLDLGFDRALFKQSGNNKSTNDLHQKNNHEEATWTSRMNHQSLAQEGFSMSGWFLKSSLLLGSATLQKSCRWYLPCLVRPKIEITYLSSSFQDREIIHRFSNWLLNHCAEETRKRMALMKQHSLLTLTLGGVLFCFGLVLVHRFVFLCHFPLSLIYGISMSSQVSYGIKKHLGKQFERLFFATVRRVHIFCAFWIWCFIWKQFGMKIQTSKRHFPKHHHAVFLSQQTHQSLLLFQCTLT